MLQYRTEGDCNMVLFQAPWKAKDWDSSVISDLAPIGKKPICNNKQTPFPLSKD